MIRTEALVKRYGDFAAVDGIDLNIPAGEIYGFLGPNGAGKTTTMMLLLGMIRPSSGSIRLFGEEYGPDRLDLRARVGMVPEKHPRGAWQWMTAEEYLAFFADLFGVRGASERIDRLLSKVDLGGSRRKRLRELSHGTLQKLSIVRALLHDPDILFLDEPISGLDPIGIKQVRDLISSENREGRTVFISSHQLSEMEKICRRVGIISHGRLVAEAGMAELLSGLSPDREMRVELESVPEGLPESLAELDFVREARAEGSTLVVLLPREGDYRKLLSERLIGRGLVPLGIEEKLPSLEDAFITITQESLDRIAAGAAK